MVLSLRELVDVTIMTLAVGYIFSDLFLQAFRDKKKAFTFSCLVTAPALILHELGHKFFALSFGLSAQFHAAYLWLVIGVILKIMGSNFIFFVPAYVSISGSVTPGASALIAFAGPLLNLTLFILSWAALRKGTYKTKTYLFLHVTKQINLFLFIFNMLPIPFFDGFKVYQGLFAAIF